MQLKYSSNLLPHQAAQHPAQCSRHPPKLPAQSLGLINIKRGAQYGYWMIGQRLKRYINRICLPGQVGESSPVESSPLQSNQISAPIPGWAQDHSAPLKLMYRLKQQTGIQLGAVVTNRNHPLIPQVKDRLIGIGEAFSKGSTDLLIALNDKKGQPGAPRLL